MTKLHALPLGNINNPCIVFIHGFLGSHKEWIPIAKLFSSTHFCILIDIPGHGQSKINKNESFETFNKKLISTLNMFHVKQCVIIGYSLGGRLALNFASKHPEIINSLILESTHPGIKTNEAKRSRTIKDTLTAKEIKNNFSDFLTKWYQAPMWGNLCRRTLFKKLLVHRNKLNTTPLIQALLKFSLGHQKDLSKSLSNNHYQTLLVTGAYDRKFNSLGKTLSRTSKKITNITIEKSGHNTHFEKKDAFRKKISLFLNTSK